LDVEELNITTWLGIKQSKNFSWSVSAALASEFPLKQLFDVLLLVAVDDGCEDTGYVAMRFDFVQFAGLDERREHGLFLSACIMAREERVFALQGDWADCAFNGVTVHLDTAIGQEQDQPAPVFGNVFERFACG
jgi:hypothetical protein